MHIFTDQNNFEVRPVVFGKPFDLTCSFSEFIAHIKHLLLRRLNVAIDIVEFLNLLIDLDFQDLALLDQVSVGIASFDLLDLSLEISALLDQCW